MTAREYHCDWREELIRGAQYWAAHVEPGQVYADGTVPAHDTDLAVRSAALIGLRRRGLAVEPLERVDGLHWIVVNAKEESYLC